MDSLFRFCGDGFDSSIDSNYNYLSFMFVSDKKNGGRGFNATVKLITGKMMSWLSWFPA